MNKQNIFDVESIGDFNNEELLRPVRNEIHQQNVQHDDYIQNNPMSRKENHNKKKKHPKKRSTFKRIRWVPIFWMLFFVLSCIFAFLIYSCMTKTQFSASSLTKSPETTLYLGGIIAIWILLFTILLFFSNKKLGSIFLIIVLIASNGAVYQASKIASSARNLFNPSTNSVIKSSNKNIRTEPFTVLVLGVDDDGSEHPKSSSEPGSDYRSDSMTLVTVNPKTHKADMVTTPRDTFLFDSCSNNVHKLTEFIGGGVKCTIDTLQTLYNVQIDYFIQANFNAVVQIVDSLGGIEVNVPDLVGSRNGGGYIRWLAQGGLGFEEDSVSQSKLNELLKNAEKTPQWCEVDSHRMPYTVCFTKFGPQVLDGEHALAFSRSRHYDSDYARGIRQTEAIRAIIQKMASPAGLLNLQPILEKLKSNYSIETNMNFQQMTDIMAYSESLSGTDTTAFQVRKHQPLGKENDGSQFSGSGIFLYKQSVLDIRTSLAITLETTPPSPIAASEYYDTIQYPAFKTNGN